MPTKKAPVEPVRVRKIHVSRTDLKDPKTGEAAPHAVVEHEEWDDWLQDAFNDNAAITYLSTFVPGFTDSLKYAVVAGAVTGGGLTVIANAPNPAGQSLLKKYFNNGVSPVGLLKAALLPTIIVWICFFVFK